MDKLEVKIKGQKALFYLECNRVLKFKTNLS